MLALPTDRELVDQAAATYTSAAAPFYEDASQAIRIFLTTRADGLNYLSPEGTHNLPGWMYDFFAIGLRELPVAMLFAMLGTKDHAMTSHSDLGFVHAGFLAAVLPAMPQLIEIAKRGPYAIDGHSLGAALALLAGALLIVEGLPPVKIGAFAPPRVGSDRFLQIVTSVPLCAYRYKDDPVPMVPVRIEPAFPYRQVPLTQLGQVTLELDTFADHAIGNYVASVPELANDQVR